MFSSLIDLLNLIAAQLSGRMTADDLPDEEMATRLFKLGQPDNAQNLLENTEVKITNWNGKNPEASCTVISSGNQVQILKHLLVPVDNTITTIRKYRTGIQHQRELVLKSIKKVEDQKKEITDWEAVEDDYVSNHNYWVDGINQRNNNLFKLERRLENRQLHMNRRLIRETMYNRFDPEIHQWVDHYNTSLTPGDPINSNIVKSMIFEESHMGTAGKRNHLRPPPYITGEDAIQSRFNIGQAIDSGGQILFLMIKEMAPNIFNQFGLSALEINSVWESMKNTEFDTWNGGNYGKALFAFFKFKDNSNKNLMGNTGKELHVDYEFWIRATVRWLFYKYNSLDSPTWPSAVKAYNGGGSKAENYKRRVMKRVGSLSDLHVGDK